MLRLLACLACLVAAATPARAENCVSREDQARGESGRPCMDLQARYARLEQYTTPGNGGLRVDLRLHGPAIGLTGNGAHTSTAAPGRTISVESGSVEVLNLGDGDARIWHIAGMRYQGDAGALGWYLGGRLVTKWLGELRGPTPTAGLRLGRIDRAALVAEVALSGLYLLGGGPASRSPLRDYDASLRGTVSVSRWLRLEGRARARDVTAEDSLRQTDVTVAAGVEAAIAGAGGFRITPVFIGLGARWVARNDDYKYHPVHEAWQYLPAEEPGFQLLLVVDVDAGMSSTHRTW